jgi:tetratricopeptide (TPR) repeat protein
MGERALNSAMKNQRCRALMHGLIAMCARDLGRHDLAEANYRASLAAHPDPGVWTLLGVLLGELGRDGEGDTCLSEALALDPRYEEAHYNLGCSALFAGDKSRAAACFRRAIQIDPKYPAALAELGRCLLREGKLDEATEMLQRSVEANPRYGWSRIYLANALWSQERLEEAESQYRAALEIWPEQSTAHWCLGDFLGAEFEDRRGEAETLIRQAIALDPEDASAYHSLGKLLQRCGRQAEARPVLERAAELEHPRARDERRHEFRGARDRET